MSWLPELTQPQDVLVAGLLIVGCVVGLVVLCRAAARDLGRGGGYVG